MILNPYFLLGLLLAFLITFGTGYHNGYQHANDHAEALELQAVAKAQKQAEKQARRDHQTAQNYETARETVRTVYVKIKEKAHANIEKHPDYADCGLDADGLRLYNHKPNARAPAGAVTDGTLPGFAGRTGWQALDDFAKQPGSRATVLRLPGTPQGAGGMGE
jgi:hypothetical protein